MQSAQSPYTVPCMGVHEGQCVGVVNLPRSHNRKEDYSIFGARLMQIINVHF